MKTSFTGYIPEFKSGACKIWPFLELLAKITRVLACSHSKNLCPHARILESVLVVCSQRLVRKLQIPLSPHPLTRVTPRVIFWHRKQGLVSCPGGTRYIPAWGGEARPLIP